MRLKTRLVPSRVTATAPRNLKPRALPDVPTPAEALGELFAGDERETRVSLSRSARRIAAQAEAADLSATAYVHQAAKVAALVHP